jgi:transposase InsO family protein
VLRTDNGSEFTIAKFAAYCADEGIQRHFSVPYLPQQMLTKYWGEAVMTAVHLLNRSPTRVLLGKTPYEAWHGRMPAVSHLKTFGCVA